MASKLKILVGSRVREARRRKGWTQSVLAEKVDLSLNMIGYIERGERFPSLETLEVLAKVLEEDPESFFRSSPKDTAKNYSREAIEELEMLLADAPPEYIRMVCRVVQELKKG